MADTGESELGEVFDVRNAALVLDEFLVVLEFFELNASNEVLLGKDEGRGSHVPGTIAPSDDFKEAHGHLDAFVGGIGVNKNRAIVDANFAGVAAFGLDAFLENELL